MSITPDAQEAADAQIQFNSERKLLQRVNGRGQMFCSSCSIRDSNREISAEPQRYDIIL